MTSGATRSGGLHLWMNGLRVGRWRLASGTHVLEYDAEWLAQAEARPISLSLPLIAEDASHRGTAVEAFFENLLPENEGLRQRLRARFAARSTHAFDLLACLGADCAGALQLLPPDEPPTDVRSIRSARLDEAGVARQVRHLASPATEPADEDDLRLSIAGAQLKTALLRHQGAWHRPLGSTPSTHILKLPIGPIAGFGLDLSDSVENEWLCAQVLGALGLPVARCEIATFEDQRVLVVERFDRRLAPDGTWWQRLPQEDACQACGVPPSRKYEADGGPGIADMLRLLDGSESAQDDRRTFFAAQVAFWLLAATDGHAKNFSIFIQPGGRFRLTPLYDVLSVLPKLGAGRGLIHPRKAKLAMAFRGAGRHYELSRIQRRHMNATAAACGVEGGGEPIIEGLLAAVPGAIRAVERSLPKEFPASVAEPILEGLAARARELASMPPT